MGIITRNPKKAGTKGIMRNKQLFLSQTILLLLILFFPFRIKLFSLAGIRYLGLFLVIIGSVLALYAVLRLKENLKPSPKPRIGGYLVTSGLYGIVRHPAYSGILLAALGISLWMNDLIRIVLTLGLFVFFDAKSRVEESWLEKTYTDYAEYKKRVKRKFIPWTY